jgi:capsular polysaccharide biosynthesis protein
MTSGTPKKFSWKWLDLGDWRLAWTSPARRPATIAAASAAAKAFYPLPLEPPYRRHSPCVKNADPQFLGAFDTFCATPAQPPPGGLALFDEAAGGVLIVRNGEIVTETAANCGEASGPFRPFARRGGALLARIWPLTPIRFVPGDSVYLQQTFDHNYGHWLVEGLPRVAIAAQFVDLSHFKFAISRMKGGQGQVMRQVMREGLALFGVKPEQIVEIDRAPVIFERMLYPMPVAIHPWVKSPNAIAVLETLPDRIGAARDGPKRIYVTRNAGKTRRLTNEDAVIDVLRPLGFVVVDPGQLSFADQIRLFAGAERIVGNCGAGLTNLVFAPRGVSVFALTTPFMQDDFFWDLTELKQGRYFSLYGVSPDPVRGPKSDFSINLPAFKEMLEFFCDDCHRDGRLSEEAECERT